MEQATLAEIKVEIDRLARVIGASGDCLPTYGRSEDFGRPHIETDSRGYHYINCERGEELRRITTRELDQLLYYALHAAASSLAGQYAVKHRTAGEDFRRPLFRREVELLGRLAPDWGRRCAEEHERILQENPFVDR